MSVCAIDFFHVILRSRKDEKTSVKCLNKMLSRNPFDDDPQQLWDAKLEMLCRYKALDEGQTVAGNVVHCDALLPSFLEAALLMGLDPGCQNVS